MSRAAKGTLVASIIVTTFTVWAVHYLQQQEHEVNSYYFAVAQALTRLVQRMYRGVLKDDERRKEKMRKRQQDLEESLRKRDVYEAVQTVRTS